MGILLRNEVHVATWHVVQGCYLRAHERVMHIMLIHQVNACLGWLLPGLCLHASAAGNSHAYMVQYCLLG